MCYPQNTHKKAGLPDFDVYNTFDYDNQGRILLHRQAQTPITGWDMGPYQHVIANNTYDELGMLESKGVGGRTTDSQRLQHVAYKYNVRGWLTDINDVDANLPNRFLFAFRINYNDTDLAESTPLFNGNISETFWKTRNDNKVRSYSYDYDALNRLKSANYHNYGYTINGHTENFTEGPLAYDKNGNIKSLKRYGIKANNTIDVIDNLTYTYGSYSNYLNKVNDAAGTDGFTNGTNNVCYSSLPSEMSYNLARAGRAVSRKQSADVQFEDLGSLASLTGLLMETLYKDNKKEIRNIKSDSYGMMFRLKGIYVHQGKYYFHIELENDTYVPFLPDFINFTIADRKVAKRTVMQQKTLEPLRTYRPLLPVHGQTTERNIYLLDVFTLSEGQVLLIEAYEKNGGRSQVLKVKNSDLVRAKPLEKLRLKI